MKLVEAQELVAVSLDEANTLAIAIVDSTKNEEAPMATVALLLAAEATIGAISTRPWDSLRSAIDMLERATGNNPERVTVPTGDLPS